jgi:predicted nucleic acid-binding Zn ribbon protein
VPIYEYVCQCTNCGEIVEISCSIQDLQKEEKLLMCKICGGRKFKRKLAPFVSHFNYTRGPKHALH